jgi:uncharacterized protein YbaR (Trm112 family)
MALLEIKCPLCKGSLWVDQSTGRVVDHKSADQQKMSLDGFLKAQQEKAGKWDEKMARSKDEDAKRKSELEERFKKARENPDEIQGEYESPFKWD